MDKVCVLVHFGNWAGLVDVMFKKNKSGQLIEWWVVSNAIWGPEKIDFQWEVKHIKNHLASNYYYYYYYLFVLV
jgi:hypothetical protein